MEKVISKDGTPIAYHRRGSGPPLVLVHGSGAANPLAWTGVIPRLEAHFSVYAVDRRGRGESGDSPNYAIQREYEDIAAVVDSTGQPAALLGHSFGALCALEAALLTRNLRKLILYEPAIHLPGAPIYPQGVIDRLQQMLNAGDPAGVLITIYRDVAKIPPEEIDKLRASPAWPARLATAHTLPREARAEDGYVFDPQRFKELTTPTLLLLGSESPGFYKNIADTVSAALPVSRVTVLAGQQHLAMYSAPELFAGEVLAYLREE